jgi:hypothetical protein
MLNGVRGGYWSGSEDIEAGIRIRSGYTIRTGSGQNGDRGLVQVVRPVASAGIEKPGPDLVAQLSPPAGVRRWGRRLEVIGLAHLHSDEHQVVTGHFPDIIVHQTIDLFGIGDDKGFAGDMQEKIPAFPEEFKADREFPVEFGNRLLRTGNKEPHLTNFINFQDRHDRGCYSQQRGVHAEEQRVF